MSGILLCVPPDQVAAIWPRVSKMIDDAYAALDELTPDVQGWLLAQSGFLWVYIAEGQIIAACTTSLELRRSGRVCRMVACGGGGLALWKRCIAQIEDYARAEGCYKVSLDGRPGWGRVLPDYAQKCVSLEKRI